MHKILLITAVVSLSACSSWQQPGMSTAELSAFRVDCSQAYQQIDFLDAQRDRNQRGYQPVTNLVGLVVGATQGRNEDLSRQGRSYNRDIIDNKIKLIKDKCL